MTNKQLFFNLDDTSLDNQPEFAPGRAAPFRIPGAAETIDTPCRQFEIALQSSVPNLATMAVRPGEERTMTKQEALARIYETYNEDQFLYVDDEPDDESIERFLGAAAVQDEAYAEIQRKFGWDDTH